MAEHTDIRRGVRTFNLTAESSRLEFEGLLNDPNVILDKSKDVQYFFDDRSCRILAVVYFTEMLPRPDSVQETPREVLDAIEGGWDAADD